MGWSNHPSLRWVDLERVLSGASVPIDPSSPEGDRHREMRRREVPGEQVAYAELHCHSNFSFLDGAAHPEEVVRTAAELGLEALALTDHNGMYGAVRFAEAARELMLPTVFGTELSIDATVGPETTADEHLLLLAEGPEGYRSLCRAVTAGYVDADGAIRADARKGCPAYRLDETVEQTRQHCVALTGCRKGAVRRALAIEGPDAAFRQLRRLVAWYGCDRVYVELTDHDYPDDSARNDLLAAMAAELGLATVATTAAHYATRDQGRIAAVLAAIRAGRGLDDMAGRLPPAPTAFLRSGAEMARRFARYPGAVARAAQLGRECRFDLGQLEPRLPPFRVQEGETENTYLRRLTMAGAAGRYGGRADNPTAYTQLDHELKVIEELEFPGYFLIVADIVRFCRSRDIYCQGRGSAANSAVCYALGITGVDAVANGLLFERFLAPDRDGPPDIDLDIESDRREGVIQYVYRTYGRRHAAQVANVITYRTRSGIRDAARALGFSPDQQNVWSKRIDGWSAPGVAGPADAEGIPAQVLELAAEIDGYPRHLGIHSGGMVICDGPVSEICPVECARMPGRTVLQWDKDDCAAAGLVKFDLLGLGMLSAIHYMVDLVADREGITVDIGRLQPDDPQVYAMLARADSVGVFQVESRAQMSALPRLQPTTFYDLVVQVALIRPGPIQGGSVHPYLRRRNGHEQWQHDHPLLAGALDKTLGVPLFQEQLMRIAIDVAGFTPVEADELRRAMGAKRSVARMQRLHSRFLDGATRRGVEGDLADRIYAKIVAFANYGFPESHAYSFAYLVYVSAWFKRYHPAAFCAGLLRAQPMGFYSSQSLVADARRHGVVVRGPDINAGSARADLEPEYPGGPPAIRIGLSAVRGIAVDLADRIVAERDCAGAFSDPADLARRVEVTRSQLEMLATAGAFGGSGSRRQALWKAGMAAHERPDLLPGTTVSTPPPALPALDDLDLAAADSWATGISPDSFPIQFVRDRLTALGAVPAAELHRLESGVRVVVAGAVTHRQRPATAGGVTFLNIEDETGMVNVICTPGLWMRYRQVARTSPALVIRGVLENVDGAVDVRADKLEHFDMRLAIRSRDFR